MSPGSPTWSGSTAGRSWTIGPSTRKAWATSSAMYWSTRSAIILACPIRTWPGSRPGWSRARATYSPVGFAPLLLALFALHNRPYPQDLPYPDGTCTDGKVHKAGRRRGALEDHQCRHRHDHPQAVFEDHQAHRPRQGAFLRAALQG